MVPKIPAQLAANCRKTPERAAWLEALPGVLRDLEGRWSLVVQDPFHGPDVSAALVAPVTLADGSSAVLKIGMPHFEGQHEIDGLRFWNGDPTVRLLKADDERNAMLLERCEPGTPLRSLPEPARDVVLARLLLRLWRPPSAPSPFRSLSALVSHWSTETLAAEERWPDGGLVREGLELFEELLRTASRQVLLSTDLHAGNVLRSDREAWLVIDPKPFVGDPAFDVTQHLFNCGERLLSDPEGTMRRMADLTNLKYERIKLWTFARAAADPRSDWSDGSMRVSVARAIARRCR